MKLCKNCKWFFSFRLAYEDDLEPNDIGWCKFNKDGSKGFCPNSKTHEIVDDDETCNYFERAVIK